MTRRVAVLALLAAISFAGAAFAQGGAKPRAGDRLAYAPLTLRVACGSLSRPPCTGVLPKLAARMAPTGLDLQAAESGGVLDSAASVCEGRADLAITQRDVIPLVAQQIACKGHYDSAGRGLFPYYAFLVVRSGAPFRQFDDLATVGPDDRRRTIAAGPEGSGGQVTLGYLLRTDPARQQAVAVTTEEAETALDRIASGAIDGFFTMETLDSPLIDRVRQAKDAAGKPLFAFIDVRVGKDLSRAGDGGGHCLYRLTALDFGAAAPVTTISVEAVLLPGHGVNDMHARGGPRVSDALNSAIDQTQAAMLAEMKAARDWRPSASTCR